MKFEDYISIYDYLGQAGRPKLGALVAKYAKHNDIPRKRRKITNPGYEGVVYLYPRKFLQFLESEGYLKEFI